MPGVYLANIGANASHPYASPLFPDGTFELLPIIETPAAAGRHSVRFAGLRSWNYPGRDLRQMFPERVRDLAAHFDPEFETGTYGDNCGRSPRAAALKAVKPGDLLFFIARLVRRAPSGYSPAVRFPRARTPRDTGWPDQAGKAGFYLIGFLEISDVLRDVRGRPSGAELARFGSNAHVRKGLDDPRSWDGFWVFGGSVKSRRFRRAVPVNRQFADAVLRDAQGQRFRWDAHRTDLQVIASYTRSVRRIISSDGEEAARRRAALKAAVEAWDPGALSGLL
jgi:hypothetical protein